MMLLTLVVLCIAAGCFPYFKSDLERLRKQRRRRRAARRGT
jgi:hypothetical protein